MDFLNTVWQFLAGDPNLVLATLGIAVVKRFKPQSGVRRGLIDITFDGSYSAGGWAVLAADLKLNGILDIRLPSVEGKTLQWVPSTGKIAAHEASGDELDGNELDTAVARCEYIGY